MTKKKCKWIAPVLAAAMLLGTVGFAGAAEATAESKVAFKDIRVNAWYYPYMSKLVGKGAINGYPDQTFKPQNTMTNAEFITTIVGATIGKQDKTGKHWASGYMDAARNSEMLVNDEMPESEWNAPITRQRMAAVIGRTTEKILKEEPLVDTEKFQAEIKDFDKLRDDCKPYVLQSYGKGIISGYPDGTFAGEKTATRAEVCSMLTRMLEPADRTMEKVAEPEEKGEIKEIISNPEDIFLGDHLRTYVISDPKLWDMELQEGDSGKWILMKDPGLTFFVIDGKYVSDIGSYEKNDGRYGVYYWSYSSQNADKSVAVETIDYIASYNTGSPVLILIPNPFKN